MGNVEGSAVKERCETAPPQGRLPGYGRLDGSVPVLHPPGSEDRGLDIRGLLETGAASISEVLGEEPPRLQALLVADEDWPEAPRESARPYPPGLPYFTQAATPPALVLPETLSDAFRPRTAATYPLAVWHELAHAFLLSEPIARTPAWLREFVPQALAAAVARGTGVPLDEHLSKVEWEPAFAVRGVRGAGGGERQMAFQKLLRRLGDAALDRFGQAFLGRLVRALREENEVVGEGRAEELLADALDPGGREWLLSRPEF